MQVVILCGGKGTRAYPYTDCLPKPLMPIAGTPILLHVMRTFAVQGHTQFILSLGYLKEMIIDYFFNKKLPWDIQFVDTGDDTDTGGRILNLKDMLDDQFMATYVDGLSDVRLDKLIAFHNAHSGVASITTVPLVSQYGTIEMDHTGRIDSFREKPVLREHWINAGFMLFNKRAFESWEGVNLEKEVFPAMVRKNLVYAYRHNGFFKSMDTYKDQQEIEDMYQAGTAPWRAEGDEVHFDASGLIQTALGPNAT